MRCEYGCDYSTLHLLPNSVFCAVIYHAENVLCTIKTMNLLETHVVGLLGEVYNSVSLASLTKLVLICMF